MRRELDPRTVRRAQRGDQRARDEVARECRELYRRVLAKRGTVGERQEDIMQEALAVLLRKLPEFRWEAKFETWALAIVFRVEQRQVERDLANRERTVLESEMSSDDSADPWERQALRKGAWPGAAALEAGAAHSGNPEREALASALREALADCLSRIAIEMREVWVRHRFWGHQHHEIAHALGLKIDTVGTRIYRVDGKMRTCLEKKGYTAELLGVGR